MKSGRVESKENREMKVEWELLEGGKGQRMSELRGVAGGQTRGKGRGYLTLK